jgi:formylglycine-generating enzyme required for sulfatase activity
MKEEKKIQQSDIDSAFVALSPVAGISPRVYLPILYSLVLAALLFFLLFLPGMRRNGSVFSFDGEPKTAAVLVDGAYKGSTAQDVFILKGMRKVTIEHRGYASTTQEIPVKGRVFGSLFFPRKEIFRYNLQALKPLENLKEAFSEFAAWSLTGKPSSLYQTPMVLSEGAWNYAIASKMDNLGTAEFPMAVFAGDAIGMITSSESARDAMRATSILATSGIAGPLTLVSASRTILGILGSEGQAAKALLKDILGKGAPSSIASYSTHATEFEKTIDQTASKPLLTGTRTLGPHSFAMFSAGSRLLGGEAPSGSKAPYKTEVTEFGIAQTEVTNRQWSSFLAANPQWLSSNRENLMDQGLADSSYLLDWNEQADEVPVTGISWHAAAAYCDWISSQWGGSYVAMLPTEAMWEIAARAGLSGLSSTVDTSAVWSSRSTSGALPVGSTGYSASGIADMFGNVWEWTSDWYSPYPAFSHGFFAAGEKTVRGGSWGNPQGSITLYSRGGIPIEHGSGFLGFRPAIIRK